MSDLASPSALIRHARYLLEQAAPDLPPMAAAELLGVIASLGFLAGDYREGEVEVWSHTSAS